MKPIDLTEYSKGPRKSIYFPSMKQAIGHFKKYVINDDVGMTAALYQRTFKTARQRRALF